MWYGHERKKLLDVFNLPGFGLDYKSALWARNTVLGGLNKAMRDAAERNGWIYVGGIASQFQNNGECAEKEKRMFNTEEDARVIQGPFSPFDAGKPWVSTGTLHPNVKGHQAYALALRNNVWASIKPRVNFGMQPGTVAGKPTTFQVQVTGARGINIPAKIRVDDDPRLFDSNTVMPYTFTGLRRLQYKLQGQRGPGAGYPITMKREAYRGHDIWITTPDGYEDAVISTYVPLQKVVVRVDPYPIINLPTAKDPKASDVTVYVSVATIFDGKSADFDQVNR